MKQIELRDGLLIENFHGISDEPSAIASTIEEAADLITQGIIPIVTASFPTWEVTDFLLKPATGTAKP